MYVKLSGHLNVWGAKGATSTQLKNVLFELFSVSKLLIYLASIAIAAVLLRMDCNGNSAVKILLM